MKFVCSPYILTVIYPYPRLVYTLLRLMPKGEQYNDLGAHLSHLCKYSGMEDSAIKEIFLFLKVVVTEA